ncbi:MAG: type I-E CRISPR-associated protein Cas6/Cse3/CasE [Trueperaceae bacterium]
MYLSRLIFNLESKHALRDINNRYQLHATLERVFEGEELRYLWRLIKNRQPHVLVQSLVPPKWERLEEKYPGYSETPEVKEHKLLENVAAGKQYSFSLEANPTTKHKGDRLPIRDEDKQLSWLKWQGSKHGFSVLKSQVLRNENLHLKKHSRDPKCNASLTNPSFITVQMTTFWGMLVVDDATRFQLAVQSGFGRGKDFGGGLLLLTSGVKTL